jgi:hypothetical protein
VTSSLKQFHLRHLAAVQDFQDADLPSLREALATIPDPRAARGVRYCFTELLVVAVAAMLTGASTLTTIAEWAADANHRKVLVGWRTTPSIATIHRVMATLDAATFDAVMTTWTRQRYEHALAQSSTTQPPQLQAIAIDGKEVCGAKHGDGTKTVLMAALDHHYGIVLGQESVEAKSNEIPLLPKLLDQLGDLTNTVITADALHTLAQQATAITSRGGHYLFTVKTNARTLYQAINDVGWSRRRPQYQHTEKGPREDQQLAADGGPSPRPHQLPPCGSSCPSPSRP